MLISCGANRHSYHVIHEGCLRCLFAEHFKAQSLPQLLGQRDVLHLDCLIEDVSQFIDAASGIAEAESGDQETRIGMGSGIVDEPMGGFG